MSTYKMVNLQGVNLIHVFVNRREELNYLEKQLELFHKGLSNGIIIYGIRRVGKTTLIREFMKNKKHIEINCGGLSTIHSLFNEVTHTIKSKFGEEKIPREIYGDFIEAPNQKLKFKRTLELLVKASDKIGNYIVFMDEFHIFLDKIAKKIAKEEHTNTERALLDIFWILKDIIERGKIFWLLSTSIGWEKLREFLQMKKKEAPLLGVLNRLEIKPLNNNHSIELARKVNPKITESEAEEIAKISGGIPKIIIELAVRFTEETSPLKNTIQLIENGAFDEIFDNMIRYAADVIKFDYATIMNTIATISEGNRTIKEISEQTGLDSRVTSAILRELQKIGIIDKNNERPSKYKSKYPLLETWATIKLKDRKIQDKIKKALDTMGITTESYIRELFMEMKNKKITIKDDKAGTLLAGTEEEITFKIKRVLSKKETEKYFAKQGVKNGDIIAEEDNKTIIIEVKSGIKDLEPQEIQNITKIKTKQETEWILVYMGEGNIKPRTITEAIKNNIKIITKEGIKKLAKKLDFPAP